MNFWMAFLLALIGCSLVFGVGYWIKFIFKRFFPNFQYVLKYKVFRFKKDPDMIEVMQGYSEKGEEGNEVLKILLINDIPFKKAREMVYIQKLLQGGKINGR